MEFPPQIWGNNNNNNNFISPPYSMELRIAYMLSPTIFMFTTAL